MWRLKVSIEWDSLISGGNELRTIERIEPFCSRKLIWI